eukprot:CAMPEP_0171129644 /NCGR_PEP_ID=MMETSP0766_2-20121228/119389_1 /TAXON_ID=439317 /ORGANISM="Gambierdiscus australes, Strain CAWD 149" /LENGTH=48 /DNA_ID= /DNA_START= /DNA_END= /DNA_ORIENTATION=
MMTPATAPEEAPLTDCILIAWESQSSASAHELGDVSASTEAGALWNSH